MSTEWEEKGTVQVREEQRRIDEKVRSCEVAREIDPFPLLVE